MRTYKDIRAYWEVYAAEFRLWKLKMLSGIYENMPEFRFNPNHDPTNGRFTSGGGSSSKDLTGGEVGGIIKSGSDNVTISAIEHPIEQQHTGKGNPNAILTFDIDLNNRQKELLDSLPEYDSRITVSKEAVNMADLSALTAKTGDEFAMFTKGSERTIIRGNSKMVNTGIDEAKQFAEQGYKWSGHTHPGLDFLCMQPSDGDYEILDCFEQKISVIYNSKGDFRTFEKRGE